MVTKLLSSIRDTITVSKEEIKDYYYKENRKLKVTYLTLNIDDFKENITYTNDELVTYYQQNIGAPELLPSFYHAQSLCNSLF